MQPRTATAMTTQPGVSYDEIPYESGAIATAHPDRLCTIGTMFGMSPTNIERCRVLELGCAEGGNLIPMALALPGSEFVGLDLSSRQVEAGRMLIRALRLDNARLETADLTVIDESWGRFDYILCHGVYSWVPTDIRDAILTICKQNLAPNGIAVISYNTYPGWHLRMLSQGMMRYHTRGIDDPLKQVAQARALLDWMAETLPEPFAHRRHLADERDVLDGCGDTYVLHEHLEGVNQPFYFHEFARQVAGFELQYLGDAKPSTMATVNLPGELARAVEHLGTDIISSEQYRDFIVNRSFRSSLLCHSDVLLDRAVGPEAIYGLALRSNAKPSKRLDLEPGVEVAFSTRSDDSVASADPVTKAALTLLGEQYPAAIRFDELHRSSLERLLDQHVQVASKDIEDGRRELAADLLHAVFGGAVQARSWCPDVAIDPGRRPRASRLSALAVALGGVKATNQFHESIALEPAMRELIPLLDGSQDPDAVQVQLSQRLADAEISLDVEHASPAAVFEDALAKLAGSGLLIPSGDGQEENQSRNGSRRPGYDSVECGVIGCGRLFATVAGLRSHAKSDHEKPAHSVHRSAPVTQYVQDLIWPPGVDRTIPNGLRRLVELEWIDKDREQEIQVYLADGTAGHHTIPLLKVSPHGEHLAEFHDGHSEVLVTIGNASSPPHIDFYSRDNEQPADFRPVSGNQLLLLGMKEWTHIPTDFLDRGFEWMREQLHLESLVSSTWPRATIHAGDETTAAGGEIHTVKQLSTVTFSMGSAFYELDNTTIPQDRGWLREQ